MEDSEIVNIVVGAVGSFCMLLAYTLLSCRRHVAGCAPCVAVTEESLLYCTLNLVGGALASASAIMTRSPGSYPLAVLEGAWAIVGAIGLWHLASAGLRPARLSADAVIATSASAPVACTSASALGGPIDALCS